MALPKDTISGSAGLQDITVSSPGVSRGDVQKVKPFQQVVAGVAKDVTSLIPSLLAGYKSDASARYQLELNRELSKALLTGATPAERRRLRLNFADRHLKDGASPAFIQNALDNRKVEQTTSKRDAQGNLYQLDPQGNKIGVRKASPAVQATNRNIQEIEMGHKQFPLAMGTYEAAILDVIPDNQKKKWAAVAVETTRLGNDVFGTLQRIADRDITSINTAAVENATDINNLSIRLQNEVKTKIAIFTDQLQSREYIQAMGDPDIHISQMATHQVTNSFFSDINRMLRDNPNIYRSIGMSPDDFREWQNEVQTENVNIMSDAAIKSTTWTDVRKAEAIVTRKTIKKTMDSLKLWDVIKRDNPIIAKIMMQGDLGLYDTFSEIATSLGFMNDETGMREMMTLAFEPDMVEMQLDGLNTLEDHQTKHSDKYKNVTHMSRKLRVLLRSPYTLLNNDFGERLITLTEQYLKDAEAGGSTTGIKDLRRAFKNYKATFQANKLKLKKVTS